MLLSDGPLTLYEVLTSGVVPRRVVLAACESGVEHSYAGGEVLGFVSALMARGTAGVVASTIPLPDGASVPLMTRLHRNVAAGDSLPHALWEARAGADRSARKTMPRGPASPPMAPPDHQGIQAMAVPAQLSP